MLFETSSNAMYNQLFAAVIANVSLKLIHVQGRKVKHIKPLSFAGFTRLFLCDELPIEWRISLNEILDSNWGINQLNTV